MAGQRVGYMRVSTVEQNTVRQLDSIELDRVFTDHISGATRNRPALEDLRRYVRDGDTVVVHSMDRLARNLDDLRALVREFTEAGVAVDALTPDQVTELRDQAASGVPKTELARQYGIHRDTVYRYLANGENGS